MTERNTQVVVIGGGYAGMLAANHLRQRADIDITLVNPRPCSSSESGCTSWWRAPTTPPPITATLLGDGIRLVVDTATRIDAAAAR